MSLPGAKAEDDGKVRPLNNDHNVPARTLGYEYAPEITSHLGLDEAHTFKEESVTSQFLGPPPHFRPHRPLSPDALSNLSVEEYDQLRPSISNGYVPPPRRADLPVTWRTKLQAVWVRNLGLLYMLLAQLFGTLMNVTTRLLEIEGNKGKGLHPFQILFARMSITVALASLYMWYKKTPHFPFGQREVRWLLVARGMGGFFGVFGMYYSLLYLPLADATVITFLAPALSCWACSFLIHEPFTRIEKIGSLISFVGVIFIARPTSFFASSSPNSAPPASGGSDMAAGASGNGTIPGLPDASNYSNVTPAERMGAVGLALLGVLGSVCAYTTIRWIGKRAHPLISVNYFAVWCTLVSTVAQLTLPGVGFLLPADLKEWGYLFFLGICGFIMQFLLAAGLSYEKSSRATNMTYTSMLFALSFDKIMFNQTPGWMSIIGSTLILGSAIFMAVQRNSGPAPVGASNNRDTDTEMNGRAGSTNEERAGLMEAMEAADLEADADVQVPGEEATEIQMRTLRQNSE